MKAFLLLIMDSFKLISTKLGECLNGFITKLLGGIGLIQTIYIILLIFFVSIIVKVNKLLIISIDHN